MNLTRRAFVKVLGTVPFVGPFLGCASQASLSDTAQTTEKGSASQNQRRTTAQQPPLPTALEMTNNRNFAPGFLTIIQGPTNKTESLINLFVPRLKNYSYQVTDSAGNPLPVQRYEKVLGPTLYSVDKLRVSGLDPQLSYILRVIDISSNGSQTVVDTREFRSIDTDRTDFNFALLSCMADDYRFAEAIPRMWQRLREQDIDAVFMTGDLVYVDSFNFVAREVATEFDIWQRFIDALAVLPIYKWRSLKPIFATWDDHDFGTNDGNRDFKAKNEALKLFRALFSGPSLSSNWSLSGLGTSHVLEAGGQKFIFADDRFYRQPNKNQVTQEPYGHWGEAQHNWIISELKKAQGPSWIVNGNQIFNGANKSFVESLEQNHPEEYKQFTAKVSQLQKPVVFASGDIHLSEIMEIPSERMGYLTYEVTSSSMHSYAGRGWENPMRLPEAYCIEHNFLVLHTKANPQQLDLVITCWGLPEMPYFQKNLTVKR